ncbi:NAD(P)H-binding protein [Streptomyces sp. SS1-1]|uniref:SDR family oxidoreductase n=1 Tax=Streptomyces sp. SS1-1 TaxID=2651869 RepID=UPI00124FA539|nr:NAD(P)H-binding protein [Streptomyces sp. SS1-1]KAB2976250.1 NAD(P)H-binding protein [Streptomyces sp. SS1-1]
MRVVVAGATGLIGSRTVARLRDHGVEVVPVSRGEGVDVSTGHGLDRALRGADVIVDVTDAPSRRQEAATTFFTTATGNLLRAAAAADVEHYVALSVVGADRVGAGYFRAKAAQEDLARRTTVPYSVVRATPFHESVEAAAAGGARPDGVHVPPLLLRPVSADDVATVLAHVAVGLPQFGVVEAAGPEELRLEDVTAAVLDLLGRPGPVIADARAPFFGAVLDERALLPGPDARLGHHTFAQWLKSR